jgi:hypothetical protein
LAGKPKTVGGVLGNAAMAFLKGKPESPFATAGKVIGAAFAKKPKPPRAAKPVKEKIVKEKPVRSEHVKDREQKPQKTQRVQAAVKSGMQKATSNHMPKGVLKFDMPTDQNFTYFGSGSPPVKKAEPKQNPFDVPSKVNLSVKMTGTAHPERTASKTAPVIPEPPKNHPEYESAVAGMKSLGVSHKEAVRAVDLAQAHVDHASPASELIKAALKATAKG